MQCTIARPVRHTLAPNHKLNEAWVDCQDNECDEQEEGVGLHLVYVTRLRAGSVAIYRPSRSILGHQFGANVCWLSPQTSTTDDWICIQFRI